MTEDTTPLSARQVLRSLERDPTGKGFSALGVDGVLRTFSADYTIVDARGLTPAQIKEMLDSRPWSKDAEDAYRGADGTKVSQEGLFNPPPEILPKKPSAEEKARLRREIEEQQRQIREARKRGELPACGRALRSNHNIDP
ncbi:hypothetical protein F5X99DRAFT_392001 [Biscogniauxia marginata]|nr:hypothetical protein F5X99DRAFT_392001 [Biscogniauxia marginata]